MAVKNIKLSSPSFMNYQHIPAKYTCDGNNTSPKLQWKWYGNKIPETLQSYVLICFDPDAYGGLFTHWIVSYISPEMSGLKSNIPRRNDDKFRIVQGKNSNSGIGYIGPCPSKGTHRYVFRIFALDIVLPRKVYDIPSLREDTRGHIIGKGTLVGYYQKIIQNKPNKITNSTDSIEPIDIGVNY